jgi:predicted dehydrogenase
MTIRVGIIGCGSIAEFRHAPEYAANPDAEIVAFYDPKTERAEQLATAYGGRVVGDYEAIISDPSIDAISDCSTNEMHHVITTRALESGKHVLCEKPMAVTLEGARTMLDASRKSGRILMLAHNQRLAPAHLKAREIIQGGELGRVITFATTFGHKGPEYWSESKSKATWFFERQRSVFGVAGDLGMHKIDLLRFLLNDEIDEVSAFAGTLDKKGVDGKPISVSDNMVCVLKTRRNTLGTLAVSWTYYGPEDNSTTLYCERGIMKIYADPDFPIRVTNMAGEEALYKVGKIQTNESQSNSGVIDSFISAIVNKTAPIVSGEDGYRGLQVVFAAMEASETGLTVKTGC